MAWSRLYSLPNIREAEKLSRNAAIKCPVLIIKGIRCLLEGAIFITVYLKITIFYYYCCDRL